MNKPTQPVPDDDLGPTLSEAEVDAWVARNRDALNESIAEARRELAEGKAVPWDIEEILADVEVEFDRSQKG